MKLTASAMTTSPKRILIVDDNEVVLEVLRDFLSPVYAVDVATSAAVALKRLMSDPPDLIFLDVKMPGTDGLALLGSLRTLGITVPIFVVTGYDTPETAAEATRSGATGYLVKPVDLRRVDQLVAHALGAPRLLRP